MIGTPPRRKAESKKRLRWGGADAAKPPAQSATRPPHGRLFLDRTGAARRDRPVAAGRPELERRAWPRLHVLPHAAPPELAARRGEQSATGSSSSSTPTWAAWPCRPQRPLHRSHVVVARHPGRRRDPSTFILLTGSDPVPRRCPVSVRTGPAWFSCRDLVVLAGTRLPDLRLREGNRGAGPHADAAASGRQAGSRATTTRLVSARKRYDRQGNDEHPRRQAAPCPATVPSRDKSRGEEPPPARSRVSAPCHCQPPPTSRPHPDPHAHGAAQPPPPPPPHHHPSRSRTGADEPRHPMAAAFLALANPASASLLLLLHRLQAQTRPAAAVGCSSWRGPGSPDRKGLIGAAHRAFWI
ncbi:hypothetical protein PVAP13_1KG527000 [Panicum virgatum]|uniref:Uncharacterized protein n=1 Tax=Panicum virgatum TaxID=38727 RepID=A0A8T0XT07_PANVG|nr:hypothetical protein PVAP13_1KG527000 [Panicum virgatum]